MSNIVNDKATLIHLISNNRKLIQKFGVIKLGLFGSFVRDEANSDSDIDLLVEFQENKKTYKNFIQLAYFLESLLGRKVELVTLKSISQFIKPYITKEVEFIQINA